MKNTNSSLRTMTIALFLIVSSAACTTTAMAQGQNGLQPNDEWSISNDSRSNAICIQANKDGYAPTKVTISDRTGNMVYNKVFTGNMSKIDLQQMKEGKYEIRIQSKNAQQQSQLVIL